MTKTKKIVNLQSCPPGAETILQGERSEEEIGGWMPGSQNLELWTCCTMLQMMGTELDDLLRPNGDYIEYMRNTRGKP